METTTKEEKINTYEITFLVNSAEDAKLVQQQLAAIKAEIVTEGTISEIQLAYPIEKKVSAYFGYIHFKSATTEIQKLNDALTLDKGVMRFLIITPPPAKPIPRRMENGPRPVKKSAENDLSNQALEEKLAALQGNA